MGNILLYTKIPLQQLSALKTKHSTHENNQPKSLETKQKEKKNKNDTSLKEVTLSLFIHHTHLFTSNLSGSSPQNPLLGNHNLLQTRGLNPLQK
jgi:hypothetical protein